MTPKEASKHVTNYPSRGETVDLTGKPTVPLWWSRARNRRKRARQVLAGK